MNDTLNKIKNACNLNNEQKEQMDDELTDFYKLRLKLIDVIELGYKKHSMAAKYVGTDRGRCIDIADTLIEKGLYSKMLGDNLDKDKIIEWLQERIEAHKNINSHRDLVQRDLGCAEAYINVLYKITTGSFNKSNE